MIERKLLGSPTLKVPKGVQVLDEERALDVAMRDEKAAVEAQQSPRARELRPRMHKLQ